MVLLGYILIMVLQKPVGKLAQELLQVVLVGVTEGEEYGSQEVDLNFHKVLI